jgi:hypothetical protein
MITVLVGHTVSLERAGGLVSCFGTGKARELLRGTGLGLSMGGASSGPSGSDCEFYVGFWIDAVSSKAAFVDACTEHTCFTLVVVLD